VGFQITRKMAILLACWAIFPQACALRAAEPQSRSLQRFIRRLLGIAVWPRLIFEIPYLVHLLSSSESMDINSLASLDFGSTCSNPSINL
jgi:hypothetical protein